MGNAASNLKARVVVVFARRPDVGAVKTRLAMTIGPVAAAQLYEAMLRDTLAVARRACRAAGAEGVVAYTPAGGFAAGATSLSNLWRGRRLLQRGDDLGRRMCRTLEHLHRRGAQSVLIIGSDAPDLPAEFLSRALAILDNDDNPTDLVLGPAQDGGFYLIGARAPVPHALFENVVWSGQSTLAQVLANAGRTGVTADALSLPIWRDVDDSDDLKALWKRLSNVDDATLNATMAPHTIHWLRAQSTLLQRLFASEIQNNS